MSGSDHAKQADLHAIRVVAVKFEACALITKRVNEIEILNPRQSRPANQKHLVQPFLSGLFFSPIE